MAVIIIADFSTNELSLYSVFNWVRAIAVINSILRKPAGIHQSMHKIDIMIAASNRVRWHTWNTSIARPICYWLFVYILLIQNLPMMEKLMGHRSSRTVICLAWLLRVTREPFFLRNETLFYIIFFSQTMMNMLMRNGHAVRYMQPEWYWRRLLLRFLVASLIYNLKTEKMLVSECIWRVVQRNEAKIK